MDNSQVKTLHREGGLNKIRHAFRNNALGKNVAALYRDGYACLQTRTNSSFARCVRETATAIMRLAGYVKQALRGFSTTYQSQARWQF